MVDPVDGCRDGVDCSSKCVKPSETTLPRHLLELPDLDPGIFLSCHRAGLDRNFPASTLVYTAIPALNGISLALDRFLDDLQKQRDLVEPRLCLGASAWEASHDLLRSALRTGLIPSINSMAVMGVVSLPGMMTGQILAGVNPGEAVRYQMVIVFMITAAATLGTVIVLLLAFRMLFSARHQLLLNRLSAKKD